MTQRSGTIPFCPGLERAGLAAGWTMGVSMRLLLGIIFGVLLTVGAAYVADATTAPGEQRMVNWDAVNRNMQSAGTQVRDGWNRLTATVDRNLPAEKHAEGGAS